VGGKSAPNEQRLLTDRRITAVDAGSAGGCRGSNGGRDLALQTDFIPIPRSARLEIARTYRALPLELSNFFRSLHPLFLSFRSIPFLSSFSPVLFLFLNNRVPLPGIDCDEG